MRPRYITVVPITVLPMGDFRSLPAEIGSTAPGFQILSPRPMEHPQQMSGTVNIDVLPIEPSNDATLVIKLRRVLPSARLEPQASP